MRVLETCWTFFSQHFRSYRSASTMETLPERGCVPAITPSSSMSQCPFCGRSFKRVGSHLPRRKERGERDYTSYLSRQAQRDRRRQPSSRTCPKCHRRFRRLDTHLRVSASCKRVVPLEELSSPTRVASEADERSEETPPASGTSNRVDLHGGSNSPPTQTSKNSR